MVGFLETKVKEYNMQQVIGKVCANWKWEHNATMTERGRITLCWHPRRYHFSLILKTDHLFHREVMHLSKNRSFYLTLVYGRNLEDQRLPLWEDLASLGQSLEDPWCVSGDFNSVLRLGERIGGVEVTEGETRDFATCINKNGLQKFQYEGAFFTWTNKTIWSRINKVFHNELWYECFAYIHAHYMSQGLSDHTPIILSFPQGPKPRSTSNFVKCGQRTRTLKIWSNKAWYSSLTDLA